MLSNSFKSFETFVSGGVKHVPKAPATDFTAILTGFLPELGFW